MSENGGNLVIKTSSRVYITAYCLLHRGDRLIGVVAVGVGRIDDGIDEEHIAIIIYQYVTVHGIEDVVLPIGVISNPVLVPTA